MTAFRETFLALLLIPVLGGTAAAQIGLGKGVFASGAAVMTGGPYNAAGTAGQSVIGRSTGATYSTGAGFWGEGGTILDVDDPETAGVPRHYGLMQNYPNPFNPATTITYEVPVASDVRISVCDILGREVAVVLEARVDAGLHRVTFDASAVSSGVYLYVLRAGSFTAVKKLVVLK